MSQVLKPRQLNIPKSRGKNMASEPRRHECERHLRFICRLPCILTGRTNGVEAHHLLRLPDPNERGGAMKSGDRWAIPLHHEKHRALHDNGNEIAFLAKHGIYGPAVAALLWTYTGQQENAERAIASIRDLMVKA